MAKLTAVIPTHNRAKLLKRLIDSLLNQTLSQDKYNIIVVDDCSTDNTQKMMKNLTKKNKIISYYRLNKPSGAGFTRNKGIEQIKEGYIVFIDDDCIAYKNTLEEIESFLKEYPFVKCFKGDPDSLKEVGLIDRYLNDCLTIKYTNYKKIKPDLYEVYNIPTCLGVYKRDVFDLKFNNKKIRFKNLKKYEDAEINHILNKKRIKFYYSPKIRCIHDMKNEGLIKMYHRKRKAGTAEFVIKVMHPDYPLRIPNNFKNIILFILNTFYKPVSIIKNTKLKYIIPFMFLSFFHQATYNYWIYKSKKMFDKKIKSLDEIDMMNAQ